MTRSSHRHRHFDPRYGPFAHVAGEGRELPDRVEWSAFSTSFPTRHRHDLEALEAYGRYRVAGAYVPRTDAPAA